MDIIVSASYVIDNKIFKSHNIDSKFDSSDYILYEVLRTTNGILIFLEDHLERLKGALEKIGLKDLYREREAIENMNSLLYANSNQKGNIKLLCRKCDSKLQYASYYVPHAYPNEEAYREGVDLASFAIERIDPGIKQIRINEYIRQKLEVTSVTKNAYDVLLINKKGLITEGSRSNFFLVRGEKIYSAEESLILPGITRKFVIDVANNFNIEIVEKELKLAEIRNYEAAFLSGTSPKVLPVKKIDNCYFKTDHPVLRMIREEFNKIYNSYINSRI